MGKTAASWPAGPVLSIARGSPIWDDFEPGTICEFVMGSLFIRPTRREIRAPVNTSFFGDMLQSIAERGRALIERTRDRREVAEQRSASLVQLCEELLSGRGEASGVALAREILSALRRAEDRSPHRLLRGAGEPVRARPRPGSAPRPRPGSPRPPTPPHPSSIAPPSRGGSSCSGASISRRTAPRRWCACASS